MLLATWTRWQRIDRLRELDTFWSAASRDFDSMVREAVPRT